MLYNHLGTTSFRVTDSVIQSPRYYVLQSDRQCYTITYYVYNQIASVTGSVIQSPRYYVLQSDRVTGSVIQSPRYYVLQSDRQCYTIT